MHSPLWFAKVCVLVSPSRLVASIADWGKKMQSSLIDKMVSIKLLKMQLVGFFNFYKIADIRYFSYIIRYFVVDFRYSIGKSAA